jgi:hypothetical protein
MTLREILNSKSLFIKSSRDHSCSELKSNISEAEKDIRTLDHDSKLIWWVAEINRKT